MLVFYEIIYDIVIINVRLHMGPFAGEVVLGLIPSVHKYFNRSRLIIMTIMIIMMMIIIILMRDCLAGIR